MPPRIKMSVAEQFKLTYLDPPPVELTAKRAVGLAMMTANLVVSALSLQAAIRSALKARRG